MGMMDLKVKPAGLQDAQNAVRVFMMFKPCAVSKKQMEKGILYLSERLEDKGIKHRFIAPVLANVSNKFADVLYKEHVGKDWFENNYKPFMIGIHPDKRVPSSPVVAFILELKNIPGQDICSILRSDDVLGPTDQFDAIAKYPERADQIKNSVRSALIGKDPIKYFDISNSPLMNRVHCSSDPESAEKDIAGFYLSIFEYVLPYYSEKAAEFLKRRLEKTKNNYELTENDFRVPLLSDESGNYSVPPKNFSINDGRQFYKVLGKNNIYRDFKMSDIIEIFKQMQNLLPLIKRLEEDFFFRVDLFNYQKK